VTGRVGKLARIGDEAQIRKHGWPDLDIDLAVESIRQPEKFPLVSRVSA
jgi:hypothetical protein